MAKSVNIRATEKMVAYLESLKSDLGISASEIIRRGIALLHLVKSYESAGYELCLMKKGDPQIIKITNL
jgi:hypothetical protein